MPAIDFSFSGWVRGADVQTVTVNANNTRLDVSAMSAEDVAAKLETGEYSISLGDFLYDNNTDSEIEILDFVSAD